MNLRCMYCQTMFGVSREVMLVGLQTIEAEKLTHYDIYCPKCRRANRVERRKLEIANPNWQEKVKALAKEAAKAEKEQVAAEKPAPTSSPKGKEKAAPATKAKKPAAKSKAKTSSTRKSAATSSQKGEKKIPSKAKTK